MFIETNKEIINNLANKHRLNPEIIESIVLHSFKCIKECMGMDEMPSILIHNWGRFKPSKTVLDRKFKVLLMYLNKYPEKVNDINWDIIKRYLSVYDRILKEDEKEEGKSAKKIRVVINNLENEYREETTSTAEVSGEEIKDT